MFQEPHRSLPACDLYKWISNGECEQERRRVNYREGERGWERIPECQKEGEPHGLYSSSLHFAIQAPTEFSRPVSSWCLFSTTLETMWELRIKDGNMETWKNGEIWRYRDGDGGMMGDGEMGRWGDGEMGRWGDGEMGRWGDGEMGRWGDGEMGRWERWENSNTLCEKSTWAHQWNIPISHLASHHWITKYKIMNDCV